MTIAESPIAQAFEKLAALYPDTFYTFNADASDDIIGRDIEVRWFAWKDTERRIIMGKETANDLKEIVVELTRRIIQREKDDLDCEQSTERKRIMTDMIAHLGSNANRDQFIERVKQLQKDVEAQEEPTGQKLLDRLREAVDDAMMKMYWEIQRDALKAADRLKGPTTLVGIREQLDKEGFLAPGVIPKERNQKMEKTTDEAVKAERTQSILRETLTVIDAAERAAEMIGCELTIQTLEYKDYGTKVEFTIRKTVVPTDDKYKDSFGPAISSE